MRKINLFVALTLLAGQTYAQVIYNVENDITHAYLNDFSYDTVSLDKSFIMDYFNMPHDYRLDAPRPVSLAWTGQAGADSQRLEVSESSDYADALVFALNPDSSRYDLYNMIPGNTYYWRVVSTKSGTETVVGSGQIQPVGMLRMVLADGTWNVRDMGGWPGLGGHSIKYGMIFRGAQLIAPKSPFNVLLSESGIEAMRNVGIRAELDLRSSSQAPSSVSAIAKMNAAGGYDVDFRNISESVNARMLNFDKNDANIRELQWVIDELKAGKPVFYHCQNGADRTGTLGFLIGALLGMNESDLAKDYELTTFCEAAAAKFDPTEKGFARLRNYEGKKGSPLSGGDNADEYKYAKLVEKMRTVAPVNGTYQRKIYDFFKNGKNGTKISEEDLAWFIKEMVDYVMVRDVTYDGSAEMILKSGQTHNLNIKVIPQDATNPGVSVKSSDESVATVTENGVITAVRGGTARITIKADDLIRTITVEVPEIESEIPDYALYNNISCPVSNSSRVVNGSFEYVDPYYNWLSGTGNKLSDAAFDLKNYDGEIYRYLESRIDGDETSEGSIVTDWRLTKNKNYVFGYKIRNSTDLVTESNSNLKALVMVKDAPESNATVLDAPSYDGNWTDVQYIFNSGSNNRLRIVFTHLSQNGNNICLDDFYLSEIDLSAGVTPVRSSVNTDAYDLNGRRVEPGSGGILIIDGKKVLNR